MLPGLLQTTHETLQGKMGTEEGRKEVLSRRQEAGERKLAKTESPKSEREVSRTPHRNHEQTVLLKEIWQLKAALRHDEDEEWVMIAQKRCLKEFNLEEEMLLSQGERAKLVRTRDWADLVKRRILTKECQLQKLTKRQVWENRQLFDQKAQHYFLEESNGKFTGKRGGGDVKLEELKWVTPVGVQ